MSNTIVIYFSKYGSTKQYAQWIAEDLGCQALPASQATSINFNIYNRVIFGSALRFDQLEGLRTLKTIAATHPELDIVAFSVGFNDPHDRENTSNIEKMFYPELGRHIGLYHVRGSFDLSVLSRWDRYKIRKKYKKALRKPEKDRSIADNNLVKYIDKKISYCNRESLWPLLSGIRHTL